LIPSAEYIPVSGRGSWRKTVAYVVAIVAAITTLTLLKSQQEDNRRRLREGYHTGWSAGTRDTALQRAIKANNYQAIAIRIPQVAKKDLREDMLTSLVYTKKTEAVRAFLDAGYDPDGISNDGKPLMAAIIGRDTNMVRNLIAHKAEVNVTNDHGESALFTAASYSQGGTEIVKMLLDAGADPNGMAPGKNTSPPNFGGLGKQSTWARPLTPAIMNNRADIATMLLDSGADLVHPDNIPDYVLMCAARNTYRSRTHWRFECAPLVEALLKHGASVEEQGRVGMFDKNLRRKIIEGTPLFVAAKKGDLVMAKLLLKYGGNPKAICEKGLRPLDVADGEVLAALARAVDTGYLKADNHLQ
jgi:ankyrin repeat protein